MQNLNHSTNSNYINILSSHMKRLKKIKNKKQQYLATLLITCRSIEFLNFNNNILFNIQMRTLLSKLGT